MSIRWNKSLNVTCFAKELQRIIIIRSLLHQSIIPKLFLANVLSKKINIDKVWTPKHSMFLTYEVTFDFIDLSMGCLNYNVGAC